MFHINSIKLSASQYMSIYGMIGPLTHTLTQSFVAPGFFGIRAVELLWRSLLVLDVLKERDNACILLHWNYETA